MPTNQTGQRRAFKRTEQRHLNVFEVYYYYFLKGQGVRRRGRLTIIWGGNGFRVFKTRLNLRVTHAHRPPSKSIRNT